jgi:hypothetical protein
MAYMDNIIIYSKSKKEHIWHILQVINALRAVGLHADIKKCEFSVIKTKFLGLIIGINGIEMDPEKVKAIQEWERPRNAHNI